MVLSFTVRCDRARRGITGPQGYELPPRQALAPTASSASVQQALFGLTASHIVLAVTPNVVYGRLVKSLSSSIGGSAAIAEKRIVKVSPEKTLRSLPKLLTNGASMAPLPPRTTL